MRENCGPVLQTIYLNFEKVGLNNFSIYRLLEDHHGPQFSSLQKKEITFVISLIRERFADVMLLGREFVRLLQNVSRIPEFEALWIDILHNPKTMCPTFNGVMQLMQNKTSRRFLRCRLTPDVERKLHFLISNVKFGNQKRCVDLFNVLGSTPRRHLTIHMYQSVNAHTVNRDTHGRN